MLVTLIVGCRKLLHVPINLSFMAPFANKLTD